MATIYHGTDVSRYQLVIDWPTYAANKQFVIIKAGGADAGLYIDGNFKINRTGARAQAGLKIGYYFFGDLRIDPATAANYFISLLGTLQNGEVLALDIENHSTGPPPDNSWAFTFGNTLYNNYGIYPFCYMSQFSPTSTGLAWTLVTPNSPLWMANYGLADTDFSRTTGNADTNWDTGGANPRYRILQYGIGSAPGVPASVDLDSFYSPNNTINDWNTFGFNAGPPPPVNGTQTTGSVAQPTMAYTQPSTQTYVSTQSYDQVLFSANFTTSVRSSSWPQTISGPTTGLTQYAYPIGNYSFNIDGSSSQANFNDYGFIKAGDFGQYPGTLPQVVVQPFVDSSGNLSFVVTIVNPSGTQTVNLSINIALMAYPNTGNIALSTVSQGVSHSNAIAKVAPSAYSTYRRIFTDSNVGTGVSTIGHGLSTIPDFLYWVQDNSGTIEVQPSSWKSNGHDSGFGISMDSNNIYFFVDSGSNAKCWYRTYLDN